MGCRVALCIICDAATHARVCLHLQAPQGSSSSSGEGEGEGEGEGAEGGGEVEVEGGAGAGVGGAEEGVRAGDRHMAASKVERAAGVPLHILKHTPQRKEVTVQNPGAWAAMAQVRRLWGGR